MVGALSSRDAEAAKHCWGESGVGRQLEDANADARGKQAGRARICSAVQGAGMHWHPCTGYFEMSGASFLLPGALNTVDECMF